MSRFENLVGNVRHFLGNVRKCQEMSKIPDIPHFLKFPPEVTRTFSTDFRALWNGNVQTSILSLEMSRNVKKCQEISILKNANKS